jgi:hypothetical protein
VETGMSDDQFQEIKSGLEASNNLVVGPSRTLRRLSDGDAIEAKERQAS